MFNVTHH